MKVSTERWTRKIIYDIAVSNLEYEINDGNENECACTMRKKVAKKIDASEENQKFKVCLTYFLQ